MERQPAVAPQAPYAPSRAFVLSLILNAILVGCLLYVQYGRGLLGDGVAVVLANETSTPMLDTTISHPGGDIRLDELPAGKSVGTTIQVPGTFEATVAFKDPSGAAQSRKVVIKPIGELLVVIHVIPEPVPAEPVATDGEDEEGAPAAASGPAPVRVFVAYQGENVNI